MIRSHLLRRWTLAAGLVLASTGARAQDAGASKPPEPEPAPAPAASPQPAVAQTPPAMPAPSIEAAPQAPSAEPAPSGTAAAPSTAPDAQPPSTTGAQVDLSVPSSAVDAGAIGPSAPVVDRGLPTTASHIRRPQRRVDGVEIIDTPLRTDVVGQDYLQARRSFSGIAIPDLSAALGQNGAGTARFIDPFGRYGLRSQPTLVLLNGRRLVSAPFFGPNAADYVDTNQLPLQLIERIEITNGSAAALHGEGAMGGVANFITRRKYDGVEVQVGGQATDRLDQYEGDVALTLGMGDAKTGMTTMVSYLNRQPLAATDRDWIGERTDRVESLLASPATFQQLTNFDYPISDPYCNIARDAGHSTGYEVRLKGYGPPDNLSQLRPELQELLLGNHDMARGDGDGRIEALETTTFCAGDYTRNNDLVLKDDRLQTYSTFWHKLSDHTEAFGELGYYRTENANRTAPAFPIIRVTPDVNDVQPVWVPLDHADQPVQEFGFATVEVQAGRIPNNLFIVGRTQGPFNGDGVNERRMDVWRGVLGLKGDLGGVAPNSVLGSWDWDLVGSYNTSELFSRVNDTLMTNLSDALNSCAATKVDQDRNVVPTTIKERQEAGCFNPFYTSVINNAAIDPLRVSSQTASSARGFVTTDSERPGQDGYGTQDGGYICDPNDPDSPPCPDAFDRDGDGVFELAGTPNTKQVIDRITGEHTEYQKRSLMTVESGLHGDVVDFSGGGLSFGLGGQFRHESLLVDYDREFNQRNYAFLFGGDDVAPVTRDVVAGYAELRLQLFDGIIELQPAARVEVYDTVGTSVNPLLATTVRPFATANTPALEWLLVRGHVGQGQQAPSLAQLYGQMTDIVQVDYRGATYIIPQQISGNTSLDFESYTTASGGVQWDYLGVHVATDFWTTQIDDVITGDNPRALVADCWEQFQSGAPECRELKFMSGTDTLDHIETRLDNLAKVSTNGVDGTLSYTLDTKRRGLGELGTFMVGVQGSFLNSYMIQSPRALAAYYRDNAPPVAGDGEYASPVFNADGTRSYAGLNAEYEAAGYRNAENFAPPLPQLRFSLPIRWMYEGHTAGATMRYTGSYHDDSEQTIERLSLPGIDSIQFAQGEKIPAWAVFDLLYGFTFGDETWKTNIAVGVVNVLDAAPPAVDGPLGYEVGIHDPRGRMVYARATGSF